MSRKKTQQDNSEFTGIFTPKEILRRRDLSAIEKDIVSDVGYFSNGDGYYESYPAMAKKLGVGRMTVIRAIERLSSPKLSIVKKSGDGYHRVLRLSGGVAVLFDGTKTKPPKQTKKFIKPSIDEVTKYAESIGFELDAQHFIDYYEARGWMIGKNRMRDWRACVRTWQKREKNNGNRNENREHSEPTADFIR